MTSPKKADRIFLSPPHMGGGELRFVQEAFDSNYVAPVGPMVDAFESEFCGKVGAGNAVAVSSGTAALHLALQLVGVGRGSEVLTSTLTFIGSVSPIVYLGGRPVLVDSDRETWNMDPELLRKDLKNRAVKNSLPKAVVVVHLYGQCADMEPILEICHRYNVPVIEDAAEALGATFRGKSAGTMGKVGIYSFNGNKIITTSGGGMLVSGDKRLATEARFLAQQAREPAPHYEHRQIGYNYRMSNIVAAIGRGQLTVLDDRIRKKRKIFSYYEKSLGPIPGIEFMPEAPYGVSTRWLTCITIDPEKFGADSEAVRLALEAENIESRPLWKPMHLQPVFRGVPCLGGSVSQDLFNRGLCLPSGTAMTEEVLDLIVSIVLGCRKGSRPLHSS